MTAARPPWLAFGVPCCLWFALLLFLVPVSAHAQTDASRQQDLTRAELEARIQSLQAALGRIRAEQQSTYQQFQMVQELRRNEWHELSMPPQLYSPPVNYDDVIRDRQARDQRLQSYASQMDRLYNRYRELEEQARPLQQELAELVAQR
jgi:hypothetical protein